MKNLFTLLVVAVMFTTNISGWAQSGTLEGTTYTILEEGFESGICPPAGWTVEASSQPEFAWQATQYGQNIGGGGSVTSPHTGIYNALYFVYSWTPDSSKLITPQLDLSDGNNYNLSFWYSTEDSYWEPEPFQDELKVFYKNSLTGPWVLLAYYNTDISEWTQDIIPLPDLTNEYYIAFQGYSEWAHGVTLDDVTVDIATAISDKLENVNLNMYPNPNSGLFTLDISTINVNELDIKITNLQGKVIFQKNNFNNITNIKEQIDLRNNAKGIYFVTAASDKGIATHKIIVE